MAQEFKIGRLRYTWRGYWETATFYNRDAVASFDGKTYVCVVPHTSSVFYDDYFNIEPSGEVKPYWVLMLDGQSWVGEWTPSTSYTLSNIVLYAGTVYKCTTNHTSTSSFDFTKWQIYVAVDSSWVDVYAPSTFYYKGDVAKFGGIVYKCITQHQANSNYFPDYTKWQIQYEGIEFKGDWDPDSVQYKLNDIVKYGPDLWICQFNHISSSGFDATIDTEDSTKAWLLWIPGSEYQSTWNQSIVYQPGDVVTYGGYSYICKVVNNVNTVPPDAVDDSTPAWDLLTTGYKFLGDWQNSTVYEIGSVIRNNGSLFQAVKNNTNQSPTDNIITTTYTAAGSSNRTLKVASTTGLAPGMFISGQGFSKGQYIDTVVDSTTLKISQAPYSIITNGATLTFSGVDTENWELITQGIRWRNRWSVGQSYIVGDIAVYINNTYRCIKNHPSTNLNRPDQDTTNTYWVIYLNHDRNNVLNNLGDIIVNSEGNNIALPIGAEGYLLKSIYGVPTWSNFLQTPKVYYVTPEGTDNPGSGTTWDNPWRSIRYACNQIQSGLNNDDAKILIQNNKNFIEEEAYQWQLYQIAQGTPPFNTPGLTLDEEKTRRDTKYLIDAITYDLARGGNSQIIAFTLSFFDKVARFKYATDEVAAQIDYFIATINRIITLISTIAGGGSVSPLYQTLNGISNPITQQSGASLDPQVLTDIESFRSIIITALEEGDSTLLPPENAGLTATIQVKTGTYREELPIVIPANTALNGDELRGVVVYPKVIINSLVTRSFASNNKFRCGSTAGMVANTPVQFDSIFSVNGVNSVFGGVTRGTTYYVVAGSITDTDFAVSAAPNGTPVILTNFTSQMYVYGGDALKDMFRCQNGTGIRNMTLAGLLGCLSEENIYLTRRPTGGAYVGLDTGINQDDTSVWIYRKSPYIQNVTTFGRGAIGLKIDGSLHNGGNKSIVCNDFTQIISDGIGIWCTGSDALCEAVSVFSYYAYAGYFAESGGRIRATNGNSSYGTFGVIAEGFDSAETPISGQVNNRFYEAQATPFSSLGAEADILKIQYSHAGQEYYNKVTNLFTYSNEFTQPGSGENVWSTDGNLTLVQSVTSPFGTNDAWLATGTSITPASGYLNKYITITPSGTSYTNISGTNITGSGVGATFNIIVSATTYIVTINSGGSGYVVSNQIRILGTQLGGVSPANDLVITVTGLSGTTITNISSSGTVQTGSIQPYYYSMFIKKGNSPTVEIQATFSGYGLTGSTLIYNFDTGAILSGAIAGGFTPTTYAVTPVPNSDNWYRLSFSFYDQTGLNDQLQVRVYPKGTSSITGYSFIYGAQLEIGDVLGFYSSTKGNRFTTNANFIIQGPGTSVEIVADEIRSSSIYKTRILEVDSITGGTGYLFSANNAQAGTAFSLTIANSDTTGEKPYLGMRLFVNNGLGAGQYGTISFYNPSTKEATILKESFTQVEITETNSTTDKFSLSLSADPYSLYVDQPMQFVPTHYEIDIERISQDNINVLSTIGGTTNKMVVTSTARLTLGMPVNFSGTTFGGVTSGFTYYIVNILDETNLQVSTTLGGAAIFLNNSSGDMQLNYPAYTSYLRGSTTNMQVNLPIFFTGNVLSDVNAGQTYYINEIFGADEFTISSNLLTVSATATAVDTNIVTVDNTLNLVNLNPIIFTGTTFGNIVSGTKYYINHIPSPTQITLASTIISTIGTASVESSDLITVASTTGFEIGNPIIFTGATFGGIVNDQVYYINYVNSSTTFSISNTSTQLTVSVTATSATNNAITVGSTTNLTPLHPIVFRGTAFGNLVAGTTYFVNRVLSATEFTIAGSVFSRTATASEAVSNLITVDSTTGFQANNPVIFGGNTFGGIVSGQVYYISAINDATSFTISATPGGSAVTLTTGDGILVVRTAGTITQATATGTMTGYSRFTNAAVSLTNGTGEVIVRTTGSTFSLATSSGTITGTTTSVKQVFEADAGENMLGTYTVPLIGGIASGTTYYVRTIDTTAVPATFTISATQGGASDVALLDGTGSMSMGQVGWDHINPGTPLTATFDSTSSYTIEPRIYFNKPAFNATSSSTYTQTDPAATYVDIAFGRGNYAALPAAGTTLAVSTNGLNWTSTELPISPGGTATWSAIEFGNYYWVIIANGNSGGAGSRVLYSNSNLQTWKTSSLPSNTTWSYLVYGNGKFVALSQSSQAAYSTNNGATWVAGSGLSSNQWRGLTYGKGLFVAIATGTATGARSTNGITWSSITLPRSDSWSRVSYGNGRFVAISSVLSKPVYSFDGQTWYSSTYNARGTQLEYGNGIFVATDEADSVMYYSEDGLVWTRFTGIIGSGRLAFAITSGVGRFVSVNGLGDSKIISGGARAKARPIVSNGAIVEINEWEPGANYTSAPTVTIADTNATVKASVEALRASGSLADPTFVNRGSGYNTLTTTISINGDGFADDYQTGISLVFSNLSRLPSPGDNLSITGDTTVYKVTSAIALNGTTPPNVTALIDISPEMTVGKSPDHSTPISIRTKYSQARLTNHDFLNIGYGNFEESNYPRLPIETVLSPQNETVESNFGRVFYSSTDQDGNFRVGELFAVEQATGIVTLSASQFGLEGLNELSIGGVSIGGSSVIITQFSTDETFTANSNNIIPTQRAIKSYLSARLTQGGSNTFTGELTAGTVKVGGPDRIQSTVPEGNQGSRVRIPVKANISGTENGMIDGDGMAIAYFFKTLISDRGVPNGQ